MPLLGTDTKIFYPIYSSLPHLVSINSSSNLKWLLLFSSPLWSSCRRTTINSVYRLLSTAIIIYSPSTMVHASILVFSLMFYTSSVTYSLNICLTWESINHFMDKRSSIEILLLENSHKAFNSLISALTSLNNLACTWYIRCFIGYQNLLSRIWRHQPGVHSRILHKMIWLLNLFASIQQF